MKRRYELKPHAASDEHRDQEPQRFDGRYRVYVYDGPDSERTMYDYYDYTLRQVLDDIKHLSDDDHKLWSLALITDNGERYWLTGMDYLEWPTTGLEWKARTEMQHRQHMALLRDRDRDRDAFDHTLPNGKIAIRMFPDHGAKVPLWGQYQGKSCISPGSLPISPELEQDLIAWSDVYQATALRSAVPVSWKADGWALYERVVEELKDIAEVNPFFMAS